MDAKTLYDTAKEYVVKMKAAAASYTGEDGMELAVIVDENDYVYAASTNVTVRDGYVCRFPADLSAYLQMKNDGSLIAKAIIVLAFEDRRILRPSTECIDAMFQTNPENDNCMAVVSVNEPVNISALRVGESKAEFANGFEFDSEIVESAPEPEAEAEPAPEPEPEPTAVFEDLPELTDPFVPESEPEQKAETEDKKEEKEESGDLSTFADLDMLEPPPMPDFIVEKPAEKRHASNDNPVPVMDLGNKPSPKPKPSREDMTSDPGVDAVGSSGKHAANVISGVEIDESNPFYEAPVDVKPPEEIIAIFGEEHEEIIEDDDQPELTKEELLKQAKKRKKVARANFLFRKKQ